VNSGGFSISISTSFAPSMVLYDISTRQGTILQVKGFEENQNIFSVIETR
jgi:hypothetical protein